MKLDDYNLTNEAKFLISSMYKEYLSRIKENVPKARAVGFGTPNDIHKFMSEWSYKDTEYTVEELINKGLLQGLPVIGGYIDISLSTDAIAIMQNSFKNSVDSVLDYASKIKNLIFP